MFELFLTLHQCPAGNCCPLVGIFAAAARAALPNLSSVCGALVLTYLVMQYELSVHFAKAAWKFPLLFLITNCLVIFCMGGQTLTLVRQAFRPRARDWAFSPVFFSARLGDRG